MFCDCPTENTKRPHITDCSSSFGSVYGIRSSVLLPYSKRILGKTSYILQLICERNLSRNNMGRQVHNWSTVQNAELKITVISPYYSDVWNVFHRSAIPDVVIVSNGGDFGAKNAVTHFTATCGTENIWRCVGSDIAVGEIGHYSKESEGRIYAINVFEAEEKKKMTIKVQKITMDIDKLSKDLKEICIRQDQILNEMSDIKVDIEELKRFSRYHPEKQH